MRNLDEALDALLDKPEVLAPAALVQIELPNFPGTPRPDDSPVEDGIVLHFGTRLVQQFGATFLVEAIDVGGSKHSVNREIPTLEIQLQNVDLKHTAMFLADLDLLQGAVIKVWRHWLEQNTLAEFVHPMFDGVLEAVGADEKALTLVVLDAIYANLSIGGGRTSDRNCQFPYNSPELRANGSLVGLPCGSTSKLPTCDQTLDGPNGCIVHENAHRYGGVPQTKSSDTVSGAANLLPSVNYQLVRDDADTTQAMRPILKVVGGTFADDPDNEQLVLTITGEGGGEVCEKFMFAWAIGNGVDAIGEQRIITFRPNRPGTITGWSLFTDEAATLKVDFQKDAFANYEPDSGDSMPGSGNEPALSSASKAEGAADAWGTVDFLAGDVIVCRVVDLSEAPAYLSLVVHGLWTGCDSEAICGANWTVDFPLWENTGGQDRPSNLYDAMQQGDVLIDADEEALGFIAHSTTAEAFIGVTGENCYPPFHHELGDYDYWFRGLATEFAAFELKTDGTWEVWQDDEATGITGSYTDGTEFYIKRATGGTDLEMIVDASVVFTTDLLGLSEPRELPASVRLVALGGAAGAIVEMV